MPQQDTSLIDRIHLTSGILFIHFTYLGHVITHPYHNFNGAQVKAPVKLQYAWTIKQVHVDVIIYP